MDGKTQIKMDLKNSVKDTPKQTKSPHGVLTRNKVMVAKKASTISKTTETQNESPASKDCGSQTDIKLQKLVLTNELLGKEWLTDESITLYVDLLNNRLLKHHDVYILPPLIVQAVKCVESYAEYLEHHELDQKNFLLMPLNNSKKLKEAGGSHWSTLIYNKATALFYHYDSIKGHNLSVAKDVARKILSYTTGQDVVPKVIEIDGPLQKNGYDCGVFMLSAIEVLVSTFLTTRVLDPEMLSCLKLSDVEIILRRSTIAYMIYNNFQISEKLLRSLIGKPTTSDKPTKPQTQKLSAVRTVTDSAVQTEKTAVHSIHNPKNKKTNIKIFSDSHGRDLTWRIKEKIGEEINVEEFVKPGAKFEEVAELVRNSSFSPGEFVILIAGANNAYNNLSETVFKNMKNILLSLKDYRVILGGVPFRKDIPLFHKVNEEIMKLNLFLFELARSMKNVSFIDFTAVSDKCYNSDGIHLNSMGKQIIAHRITKEILAYDLPTQTGIKVSYESAKSTFSTINDFSKCKGFVQISEENMRSVIQNYQHDSSVAFAHSISADLSDDRSMSAGVAVVFKRHFGKPLHKDCVNSHLAYQQDNRKAGVYSLITKPKYYGKPTKTDYDVAFTQLAEDFKIKGFKTLFCSPIGCVRDNVKLKDFVENLLKFQAHTGAHITVVSYDQRSTRSLRNGMTHDDFNAKLKSLVQQDQTSEIISPSQKINETTEMSPSFRGWETPEVQQAKNNLKRLRNINPEAVSTPSTRLTGPPHARPGRNNGTTVPTSKTQRPVKPRNVPGSREFSETVKSAPVSDVCKGNGSVQSNVVREKNVSVCANISLRVDNSLN